MIDKLHYISQSVESSSHLAAIKKVLIAGGKWIQLRVKDQPEDVVLQLAIQAQKLCAEYHARLIINDYPAVALSAGAYGVHLGLGDLPIAAARAITGPEMIIGGTANTFEHIKQRADEGADYIGLGPYRFTTTKQNLSPVIGLQGYSLLINQVQQAGIRLPIIAIGGIETADIPLLMQTGVHGIAVSGALTRSENPAAAIQNMYYSLQTVPSNF